MGKMSFNEIIKKCIEIRDPMSFGKLGGTESSNLFNMLKDGQVKWTDELGINAGVFPLNPEIVNRWALEYIEAVKALDGIVVWTPQKWDKTLVSLFNPDALISNVIEDLLPLSMGSDSWHYHLKNKKLLVIHPMKESIQKQCAIFSELWQGSNLGAWDVVKSPYQPWVAGKTDFVDYFHALDHMKKEVIKRDFDFAVVGAGAYSLPLLRFIKSLGIPSVHLGGATQLMFGIKGNRWKIEYSEDWKRDNFYDSSSYWIDPLPEDVPENFTLVEGGCYW